MYNRYVLQPDGSYQKKRFQEPAEEPVQEPLQEAAEPEVQETVHPVPPPPPAPPKSDPRPVPQDSAGGFLRNLLPKNLDTGDLLIIILLLLMSADNPTDGNTALLTLALYLFL